MNSMTLTEVSYYSRKYAPVAVLFFLVFLIFFYAIKLLFIALQGPTKEIVHTNPVFGKIKKPFVKEASLSGGLNFTLDTVEGQPVTASEAAKVYFLPVSTTRFGYREKIYLIAKTLGFDTALIKHRLVDTDAVFTDSKQKATIDITNFNFSYQYNFEDDPKIFENIIIPSSTEITNKAIDFLKTVGRYPDELTKGKTNIIYLTYNQPGRSFTPVERPQLANTVEIDFYRPDIDGFPMISPNYFNSQNYVIMAFYDGGMKVLRTQIKFFEKSEGQIGVYPLKTGDAAWSELKEGKGMVVSDKRAQNNITIKVMRLGYLDPSVSQDYLQPIYFFLGDNNFVAYVPAVNNDFLTE